MSNETQQSTSIEDVATDVSFEPFAKPELVAGRFANPASFINFTGIPGIREVFRVKFREKNDSKLPPNDLLNITLPVEKPEFNPDTHLSLTWLGHATCLVRLDGVTMITDPVWTENVSILPRIFPFRRYRPPPITIEELPQIDIGVISHNHYDHLEIEAVKSIAKRFPKMLWFVPLGMKEHFSGTGVNNISEMTWGDKTTIQIEGNTNSFDIWCLPAQHWSQRGLFDRNKVLWSGWALIGPKHRFFFPGDTGFCEDEFRKIGKNLGPFDLAAIPIGCFRPSWFMKAQHIGPTEAVRIHQLIKSKKSFGIHWGTYNMGAYEAYLEPMETLKKEAELADLNSTAFTTLNHGATWSKQ